MRARVATTLVLVLGAAVTAALSAERPVAAGVQDVPIALPSRIAPAPPPAEAPGVVPAMAASLPSVTFVVTTTRRDRQGVHRSTQTMTRAADRARLVLPGGRHEWLFVRNRLHRDRVSGYLIDHDAKKILFHDETPLRHRLGIRGWLDVLAIRFAPAVLDTLRRTAERRAVAGASASRFVAGGTREDGLVEVWWSDDLLLPVSVTRRLSGVETTSVVGPVVPETDLAVLEDPADRFPTYKNLDAADADDH